MYLVVIFFLLFASCPAIGQQRNIILESKVEQRVALVIGNAAYKESPLANPVNDATDMAKALQDAGFKVILKRNANTREMRQAIREFSSELRRAQVGLFYFAGHGIQVKGANYLVPVGTDIQSEADTEDLAVDANFVLRSMEESQTKVSIIILDACRNNPFARSFRSVARGLAQMSAATGSLLAFATAPGSVAADGTGRNGIYTKHLLSNLKDGDPDILKVFQRTRAGVVKETAGRQTPWESTSLVGDFYFHPARVVDKIPSDAPSVVRVQPIDPTANHGSFDRAEPVPTFRDCDACPEMATLPAGSFDMGESDATRRVTIGNFAIAKTEITQGQWRAVMASTPSYLKECGDECPVEQINWNDAQEFVRKLGELTGKPYRLPSEAEWEYACRAGGKHDYCGSNDIESVAWYSNNSDGKTHPVARKQANAWGLYDMSGNVWEWTEDCWNSSLSGAPTDGKAWVSGQCSVGRVLRGGSWGGGPRLSRADNRNRESGTFRIGLIGLRVVRMLP